MKRDKGMRAQVLEKIKEFKEKNNEIYDLAYDKYRDVTYNIAFNTVLSKCVAFGILVVASILFSLLVGWEPVLAMVFYVSIGCCTTLDILRVGQKKRRAEGRKAEFIIFVCSKGWLKDLDEQIVSLDQDLAVARKKAEERRAEEKRRYEARVAELTAQAEAARPQFDALVKIITEELGGKVEPAYIMRDEGGQRRVSPWEVILTLPRIDWNKMTLTYCDQRMNINQENVQTLAANIAIMRNVLKDYHSLLEQTAR